MKENDDFAIEEYLKEYIKTHLDYGYTNSSISKVLVNFGYPYEMVDKLFLHVQLSPRLSKRKLKSVRPAKLTKDLFEYLIKLLVDYIDKQLDQGYEKKEIIRVLEQNGFDRFVIEQSFLVLENKKTFSEVIEYCSKKKSLFSIKEKKALSKKKSKKSKTNDFDLRIKENPLKNIKFPAHVLYGVSLIILIFVIFFMSILTGSTINKVFLGFFATFMSITATYAYVLFLPKTEIRRYVPLFAIILTLIVFAIIIFFGKEYLIISQYDIVLMLNIMLVFFLSSLIALFSKETEGKIKWKSPKEKKPVMFADASDDKLVNDLDKENKKIVDYLKKK